jgi:hypothetical protein
LFIEMDNELRRSGRPRLQCALDRCRGLIAGSDSEAETVLVRSIETAARAAAPFERARSLLCLVKFAGGTTVPEMPSGRWPAHWHILSNSARQAAANKRDRS